MMTRYYFSRSNFLVECVAGLGGALLCGVPGVIVGSFYGSVYPTLQWGNLFAESAGGMFGLLYGITIGGWLMVYLMGQIVHDHRSGYLSFISALIGASVTILLFDVSLPAIITALILAFPVLAAAFGYNLPWPRAEAATNLPIEPVLVDKVRRTRMKAALPLRQKSVRRRVYSSKKK
jgi:hypothetical protein